MASTGFEQPHASFSPGKYTELKARESPLVLCDEDGAPPNSTRVDLEGGTAVVRRD